MNSAFTVVDWGIFGAYFLVLTLTSVILSQTKIILTRDDLIRYLRHKYPSTQYLIGHHAYTQIESTPLRLEKDKGYRTVKTDPRAKFMAEMREGVEDLHLKMPPKNK